MRLDTATNIITDALRELAQDVPADVYASTSAIPVQMRALLKALGRRLVGLRDWSHLQKEHTFATVNGTESYALPSGFVAMLASTEWNRSTDLPLGGPLHAQGWQVLKSSSVVNPVNYFYRVYGNRLYLHPTPSTAETLAFEYRSAYWVQPTGQTAPTTDAPTANTDTLWFDAQLLSRGLKVAFLEAKGFDASAARNDYEEALTQAMGNDGAHAVLDLTGGERRRGPRLPETNWGV